MRRVVAVLLAGVGCTGGEPREPGGPTWHQDIAPIVVQKCSGCHREGGIGPFPAETYAQARDFAPAMLASIEGGSMPPFLAQESAECAPRLPWMHDLRLSADDLAVFRAWVEAEMPEGDPADAAPIAEPDQGTLEREDIVLTLPAPISVEGPRDLHTCVVMDPGLTSDGYVTGRLVTAGNEQILHHVVSYLVLPSLEADGTLQTKAELEADLRAETGAGIGERYDCFGGATPSGVETEMLDAWAPGALPNLAPEGSGQPIPKDALVIVNLHYHPSAQSGDVDADTRLSLMLADEPPALISQTVLLGNFESPYPTEFGVGEMVAQPGEQAPEFRIPAGATGHVEEMIWEWRLPPGFELSVYGMGTHMHYVGRGMQVFLETAREPSSECLIDTPSWDFNWQRGYVYAAAQRDLPVMRDGDVLRMRCTYDNSLQNPFLLAALGEQGLQEPIDVYLGEDTLDEMCLAAVAILYPNFP